jgi:DNA-directed RNA polymerase subunit H
VITIAKKTESKEEKEPKKKDVLSHILVPKHTKISDKEKQELYDKYKINHDDLPRISIKDPAVAHLDLSTDDVIRVDRASMTSKDTVFYRRVVK